MKQMNVCVLILLIHLQLECVLLVIQDVLLVLVLIKTTVLIVSIMKHWSLLKEFVNVMMDSISLMLTLSVQLVILLV